MRDKGSGGTSYVRLFNAKTSGAKIGVHPNSLMPGYSGGNLIVRVVGSGSTLAKAAGAAKKLGWGRACVASPSSLRFQATYAVPTACYSEGPGEVAEYLVAGLRSLVAKNLGDALGPLTDVDGSTGDLRSMLEEAAADPQRCAPTGIMVPGGAKSAAVLYEEDEEAPLDESGFDLASLMSAPPTPKEGGEDDPEG